MVTTPAASEARPAPRIAPPEASGRWKASQLALGAGRGLRVAAMGAGHGLRASLGFARKSIATGSVLAVRTARVIGQAAGGVVSGARSTRTRLVTARANGATRPLDGEVLQNENIRTMTDVAERLLREAREENARLAKRVAALEALFAAERPSGGKFATARGSGRALTPPTEKPAATKATSPRHERTRRANGVSTAGETLEARREPALAANADRAAPRARRKVASRTPG